MSISAILKAGGMLSCRWLIPLWLCVAQGCGPHRAGSPDLSIIDPLTSAILDHAESVDSFVDPQQPLMIDLQSFMAAAQSTADPAATKEAFERILPRRLRDVTRGQAVRCRSRQVPRDCGIRGDALFIQLNGIRRTPDGIDANATYMWTDRRSSGRSGVGWTRLRISLKQSGDQWLVRETSIEGIT